MPDDDDGDGELDFAALFFFEDLGPGASRTCAGSPSSIISSPGSAGLPGRKTGALTGGATEMVAAPIEDDIEAAASLL